MAGAFFIRLKNYLVNIGEVLKGKADASAIFPNASDIGTSRERIYAEVLKQHLPKSCTVSSGGFLFDMEGNESNQIDLLVLNDASPQFNFHNPDGYGKSFACIDGCVAVVSIKSTLRRTQLFDALDNLASLPNKVSFKGKHNPLIKISNYEDWPYKIIYASDGVSIETTLKNITHFYKLHPEIPPYKMPNIIHVCGKYNIVRVEKGATTRNGTSIEENTFWGMRDPSDSYARLTTILEIQLRVQASNQLLYNYLELINRLPM